MKIIKVEISNFRILENVTVDFDKVVTLIVGRNNSGKTSFTELFNLFFNESEKSKFRFEDFSLNCHKAFLESKKFYDDYKLSFDNDEGESILFEKENLYKDSIPKIELKIHIEYDDTDDGKLASVSQFLMDLNTDRKDALLLCEYGVFKSEEFFKAYDANSGEYKNDFLFFVKKNQIYFSKRFFSVDSEDYNYKTIIEKPSEIENVFLPRFIHAQTNLDDKSEDNKKGLSRGFESYFKHNKEADATAKDLKISLDSTSINLDDNYNKFFSALFDDLKTFGVNSGVNLQEIAIKSHFEVEKVLKNNANLYYKHDNEQLLPEQSNGLGYSKLIHIVLTIITHYEEQSKKKTTPNFSLLFIEEPEAHLHPQMQQTFIKNISSFIKEKKWNAQIIITTHSSHIVSEECTFDCIRYFDNSNKLSVEVKNLTDFSNNSQTKPEIIKFLKQYLTFNKSDMFFADKIIMIEGVVERLLLPEMIRKEAKELLNQYISIIEVGGAYAFKFKDFLEFINVKTLIITDIDSVKKEIVKTKKVNKACPVKDGQTTSNATLKSWIPKKIKPNELIACIENEKMNNGQTIRVAYQIPEENNGICGRSFEEAFIIKNADVFSSNSDSISCNKIFKDLLTNNQGGKNKTILTTKTKDIIIQQSYQIAEEIPSKTAFAFDIMMLEGWNTPKYIKEGLQWLEK